MIRPSVMPGFLNNLWLGVSTFPGVFVGALVAHWLCRHGDSKTNFRWDSNVDYYIGLGMIIGGIIACGVGHLVRAVTLAACESRMTPRNSN